MLVPFTEKTFEKYVAIELGKRTNQSFSPDQPLEAILGFDDSFFLPLPVLLQLVQGLKKAAPGSLKGVLLSELEHISKKTAQHLPPFKLNLFIQYKRPEHMKRATAAEWNSWGDKYYRYSITPHQQDLLEKLDSHAAGRAVTLYASAAFHTSANLYKFAQAGTVLENSNLAAIAQLTGHQRFTYDAAGSIGVAHSEPERVEGEGLAFLSRLEDHESLPLDKHIISAAKMLDEVVMKATRSNRYLFENALAALDYDADLSPGDFMSALRRIVAFSDAFNVTYYAIG